MVQKLSEVDGSKDYVVSGDVLKKVRFTSSVCLGMLLGEVSPGQVAALAVSNGYGPVDLLKAVEDLDAVLGIEIISKGLSKEELKQMLVEATGVSL